MTGHMRHEDDDVTPSLTCAYCGQPHDRAEAEEFPGLCESCYVHTMNPPAPEMWWPAY